VKEGDFSLRARRSARVGLRTAAQVTLLASKEIFNARTSSVNRHGVRLECKGFIEFGQEVLVHALTTGKTSKGKIAWSSRKADANGYFELAIEFDKPANIFGVQFPDDSDRNEEETSDKDTVWMNAAGMKEPPATSAEIANFLDSISKPVFELPELVPAPAKGDLPSTVLQSQPKAQAAVPFAEEGASSGAQNGGATGVKRPNGSLEPPFPPAVLEAEKMVDAHLQKMADALEHNSKHLRQQTDLIFAAIENCRKEFEEQMQSMETRFVQQCRSRSEQLLSACIESAGQVFSDQIDVMSQRMTKSAEKILHDMLAQFERRCRMLAAETQERLHAQPTSPAGEPTV